MSTITESRYFHAGIVTLIAVSLAVLFVAVPPASAYTVGYGNTSASVYDGANNAICDKSGTYEDQYGFACRGNSISLPLTCPSTNFAAGSSYLLVQSDSKYNILDNPTYLQCAASTAPTTTTTTPIPTTPSSGSSFSWPNLDVIGWLQQIWSTLLSIPQTILEGVVQLLMTAAYPAVVVVDVAENVFANFYSVLVTFLNALISIPNTIIDVWNLGLFSAFPTTWTVIMMSELFIVLGLRLYSFLKDVEILGNKI